MRTISLCPVYILYYIFIVIISHLFCSYTHLAHICMPVIITNNLLIILKVKKFLIGFLVIHLNSILNPVKKWMTIQCIKKNDCMILQFSDALPPCTVTEMYFFYEILLYALFGSTFTLVTHCCVLGYFCYIQ